jgi:hypothetical protein
MEHIAFKGRASPEGGPFNSPNSPNCYGSAPFCELHVWGLEGQAHAAPPEMNPM